MLILWFILFCTVLQWLFQGIFKLLIFCQLMITWKAKSVKPVLSELKKSCLDWTQLWKTSSEYVPPLKPPDDSSLQTLIVLGEMCKDTDWKIVPFFSGWFYIYEFNKVLHISLTGWHFSHKRLTMRLQTEKKTQRQATDWSDRSTTAFQIEFIK